MAFVRSETETFPPPERPIDLAAGHGDGVDLAPAYIRAIDRSVVQHAIISGNVD